MTEEKMYKFTVIIINLVILISLGSCGYSNLPIGEQENQRIIEVTMNLGGEISPILFYYIVFNLDNDPTHQPYSVFEGEDKGKYWTVYYMYGQPPFEDLQLYRGFGGTREDGFNLVDKFPEEEQNLLEIRNATITGSQMSLRIELTNLGIPDTGQFNLNMNMIVCSQPIDITSQIEYDREPYVFDSFYNRGISINLNGNTDFFNENFNPQEEFPNENEDIAPPSANITNWVFQIIT